MTYIIYKYTFPNGKVYIGQTKKDSKRLNNMSKYYSQVVYNAMKKYKTWDTEILLECPENLADWWETSMIKIHDSMNRDKGYNRESGGHKNKHSSDETKKKISNNRKNNKLSERSNNPRARAVYLVDTIDGCYEYYPCIKDIFDKHPDWSYTSLTNTLYRKSLFNKRYKLQYVKKGE